MKLSARDARRFLQQPDPGIGAILLFGEDAMRVTLARQTLTEKIAGHGAVEEMRISRLGPADIRNDTAALADALKARGFFAGPRVVSVEDATDGLWQRIEPALTTWAEGDAVLIVAAGQLTTRSRLRKGFEAATAAVSIGIYNDPPDRDAVETAIRQAGLQTSSQDGLDAVFALSQALDPGDFTQFLEKLALYCDEAPVDAEAVAAVAPATSDVALAATIDTLAEGDVGALIMALRRLAAQGSAPTSLCIAAARHFRNLHRATIHARGPEAALAAARPPVYGPRRDKMARQARHWGSHRLERVLAILNETDLKLRSGGPSPDAAVLERAFLRIALLHQ